MVEQKTFSRTVLAAAAMASLAGAGQAYAMVVAGNAGGIGIPMEMTLMNTGLTSTTKGAVDIPVPTFTLGQGYIDGDQLVFTLSGTGCTFASDTYYLAFEDHASSGGSPVYNTISSNATNGGGGAPWSTAAPHTDSTGLTFRVTEQGAMAYGDTNNVGEADLTDAATVYYLTDEVDPDSAVAGTFDAAAGPDVMVRGLATDGAKCTLSASVNDGAWDNSGTTSADIVAAYQQFDSSVSTALSGVIDVDNDRLSFESNVLTDVMGLTLTSDNTGIHADFEIVTDSDDEFIVTVTTDNLDDVTGITTLAAGCSTMVIDTTTDSAVCTYTGANLGTVGNAALGGTNFDNAIDQFTFTLDGTSVLETRDFSLDVQMILADEAYSDFISDDEDAGSWTLNGMQAKIPYYLIGNSYAWNFLKITNETVDDADVTIDATIQNLTTGVAETEVSSASLVDEDGAAITASANSVTAVSTEDLTQTLGLGSDSYLTSLTVTVNGPANSIHVTGHLFTSTGREALPVLYPTNTRNWLQ